MSDYTISRHHVFAYHRIAVRGGDAQPFRWFSPPVAVLLRTPDIGRSIHENNMADAVFRHPTQHIRQVEVRSPGGYTTTDTTIDWDACLRTLNDQP